MPETCRYTNLQCRNTMDIANAVSSLEPVTSSKYMVWNTHSQFYVREPQEGSDTPNNCMLHLPMWILPVTSVGLTTEVIVSITLEFECALQTALQHLWGPVQSFACVFHLIVPRQAHSVVAVAFWTFSGNAILCMLFLIHIYISECLEKCICAWGEIK